MSDNLSNALPSGTVLTSNSNRYTIEAPIGAGGFGITYRSSGRVTVGNIRTSATFAIKEFFIAADCERGDTLSGDTTVRTSAPARKRVEAAKRDFVSEAKRLYSLAGHNRNIVSVNEVFQANDTAYYVMEFLDGPSLRDYIRSRVRLSEAETLELMLPIISAVAYLHSRKITHLDIKPANIVLATENGSPIRPVLIDFGQSRHYDDSGVVTCTVNAAGLSEGYAPIEQYAGVAQFSPTADVYALGATLFHCLTGQKPPRAMDITPEYIASALPANLCTRVRNAIVRAMTYRADQRTPSADELYRQLTSDDTIFSEPPRPPRTPRNAATSQTTQDTRTIRVPEPPIGSNNGRRQTTPAYIWVIIGLLVAAIIAAVIVLATDRRYADTHAADESESTLNEGKMPAPTIVEDENPAPSAKDDAPAAEEAAPAVEEVRTGTPPPMMHTYYFKGDFIDSNGKRWPVKLEATTDNQGRWGNCVYTNVSQTNDRQKVILNMKGSGSDDNFSFYTNEQQANLTINIHYEGEGMWVGTATNSSKTLKVELYE